MRKRIKRPNVVLVCHYPEAFPDLLPLYELMTSKDLFVSFLFSDGWLLGPANQEGIHRLQDTKDVIRDSYTLKLEVVGIDQIKHLMENSRNDDWVFFLATHYLESLPLELQQTLSNARIFYSPYGYPTRQIDNNLSITPNDNIYLERIIVQDELELVVWEESNPKSILSIAPKPFSYKKSSVLRNIRNFQMKRICFSLHHNSLPNGLGSGLGNMVYHLDEIVTLIEKNSDNFFLIRTHPIFLSKLRMHANEDDRFQDHLKNWYAFSRKVELLPNAKFSQELDWESDFAQSGIVFTESPSLAVKSRYRFRFDLSYSVNVGQYNTSPSKVYEYHKIKSVTSFNQIQEAINRHNKFRYIFAVLKYFSFLYSSCYSYSTKYKAWRHLNGILKVKI
jgi:hypothetical protein